MSLIFNQLDPSEIYFQNHINRLFKNEPNSGGGDSGSELKYCGKIVIKTGTGVAMQRLKAQAVWYHKVPEIVRRGTPKILGYNWTPSQACLVMENANLQNFSNLICSGSLKNEEVVSMLKTVLEWIESTMYTFNKEQDNISMFSLLQQTTQRVKGITSKGHLLLYNLIHSNTVIVNGERLWGGTMAFELLKKHKKLIQGLNLTQKFLVHGDLHTGNILCGGSKFKLIDQRGNFTGGDIFFDLAYDSGKLLHDLHGKYSLIRSEQFQLKAYEQNVYEFHITRNDAWHTYENLLAWYCDWYKPYQLDFELWWAKSMLAEALILCGIIPFHIKNYKRVLVIYLSGLVLLNRWLLWAEGEITIEQLFFPLDENLKEEIQI
ncbi:hypothetical protein [Bacillus gobiensis]|uniref:hypothetical protein n=1 Tax=Bacillus gobiensis TaxID=1441095 RepID=UPI003D1F6750